VQAAKGSKSELRKPWSPPAADNEGMEVVMMMMMRRMMMMMMMMMMIMMITRRRRMRRVQAAKGSKSELRKPWSPPADDNQGVSD
jgi:heme/copper-type cytochrome/quinol oxidase subunit 2